jgi:hypothetical protein
MVQPPPSERVFADLEREIAGEVQRKREPSPANAAAPSVGAPALVIPNYVEHSEGATEIGKLSAEAVVSEYEAAAKEIEAMGAELIERVKQCETMTRDALAVTKELQSVAARYREEAKRVFVQIENCSTVASEVRKTCIELMDKLAVPSTTDRSKPKKR